MRIKSKIVPSSESAFEVIRQLKRNGYQIIFVEQTRESIPYDQFEPKTPVCLVVGNEITGVEQEILSLCDQAVEIPMAGEKNSLNVTVAFGIVAYHVARRCQALTGTLTQTPVFDTNS